MSAPRRRLVDLPILVVFAAIFAWKGAYGLFVREPLHGFDLLGSAAPAEHEAVFYCGAAVVQIFVVAGLTVWIGRRWGEAADRLLARAIARPRAALLALAILAAVASLTIALVTTHQHTVTEDEKTYLFQSKLLLLHRLSIPVPPEAKPFWQPFIVHGRAGWTGQYFWAQSAFLALGLVAGSPWLVPPLEVAGAVYFTGRFVEELSRDPRAAILAAFVVASSPIVVLTGATLNNASLSTACVALTLWSLARLARLGEPPSRAATVGLGLSTGVALHNRPFDHAIILAAAAVVLVVANRRDVGALARRLAPAIALSAPFLLLHLALDTAITGDATHSGYSLWFAEHHVMSFGFDSPDHVHVPAVAFAKTLATIARLLFYVAGGPFVFAPVVLLLVAEPSPGVFKACAWTLFAYMGAYFFYAAVPIYTTGPVYFDALIPVVAAWVALAAVRLHATLGPLTTGAHRRTVPALFAAQAVAAALVFWPTALGELGVAAADSDACEAVARAVDDGTPMLVFVDSGSKHSSWTFWGPLPSPRLDDRVLFPAESGAAADSAVAARFGSGRATYLAHCVDEPSPSIEHFDPLTGESWPISRRAE